MGRAVSGEPRRQRFTKDGRLIYEPDGLVLVRFLLDRRKVSIIRGPVGSGKSKAANMKCWAIASEQEPMRDGMRRTRWAVVRNTYPELRQTTMRTWIDTFPEAQYGAVRWSVPFNQVIRCADVEMEVDFLALDKPDDVKKLRSGEYTGFYVNELQYTPKELFDEMTSRAGRYPAMKDGGPTWYGVLADMNAPEEDHWLPPMLGELPYPEGLPIEDQLRWPEEWGYYLQPAGLSERMSGDGKSVLGYEPNPAAENVAWLVPGYYLEQIKGKSRQWIDSRVMNRITVELEGTPVWPQFRRESHVAKEVLPFVPGQDLWVGLDFGRQPAAVIGQSFNMRVNVLAEIQGFDEGATTFAPRLKAFLEQRYAGAKVRFVGDPKGRDRGQADDRTPYDVFAAHGMKVEPAPVQGNNIRTRIEAVEYVLNGMYDGRPRFQLSPACRSLAVGMQGKYHYKKTDESKFEPVKNKHSHLADALQYLVLGMGEGRAMVGLEAGMMPKPVVHKGKRGSGRRVQ